jgi:hypothetical protein
MSVQASAIAIVVIGLALTAPVVNGQVIATERSGGQPTGGTFQLWRERSGISRPISQTIQPNGTSESVLELSPSQGSDSAKSSRAHNVIIGALVGGAIGLGVGLLLDHTGKSGGGGSGEHITYTFEVYTIPIGIIVGAASALLVSPH